MRALVRAESWPIRGGFRIARGPRAVAEVLVVELHDGPWVGRGECVPYPRYGESVQDVCAELEAACADLERGNLAERIGSMRAGAARNALDCALWDLRARRAGTPVWSLAGLDGPPVPVQTMRTVSVGSPAEMARAAAALDGSVLKVKVDGGPDLERLAAVHAAAPASSLVVDANEAWSEAQVQGWMPELRSLNVVLLEQPRPADDDAVLAEIHHAVPVCADESFHDRGSFARIEGRYEVVNIKLDKTGGLTEALACAAEAKRRSLPFMIGCMVSTTLAIAPALLLARDAAHVDLDGPLLLEADREGAAHDRDRGLLRPAPSVWGP